MSLPQTIMYLLIIVLALTVFGVCKLIAMIVELYIKKVEYRTILNIIMFAYIVISIFVFFHFGLVWRT